MPSYSGTMPNSSHSPAMGNKSCDAKLSQATTLGISHKEDCQDGPPQSRNNSHWHTGTGTNPTASFPNPDFMVGQQDFVYDWRSWPSQGSLFLCFRKGQRSWVLYTVTADGTRRPPPETHSSQDKGCPPSHPTSQWVEETKQTGRLGLQISVIQSQTFCKTRLKTLVSN